jgi:23S rRNA pseudouridine955/2504/2580 synthase
MVHEHTISKEATGQRLDQWLKTQYPNLSYGVLQKWLRTGQIRLNGKRSKGSAIVKEGDRLRLPPQIKFLPPLTSRPMIKHSAKTLELLKHNIIFDDEDCCVINKPIGLAVQGGTRVKDYVDLYLAKLFPENAEPLRLTHRIDKDTSGILLLAKLKEAARRFTKLFKEQLIQKRYLAIVVGQPKAKAGVIKAPVHKKEHSEPIGQKAAITEYRVLAKSTANLSLLELIPKTGRTHQLRIHCAINLECPILGDGKYGGKQAQPFPKRLSIHLHAFQMKVPDETGLIYQFTAPLPEYFQNILIEYFEKNIDLLIL